MRILLVALGLCCASVAFALMPPHVTGVSPAAGQPLIEGRIVKFHGYSLNHRVDALRVVDGGGQGVNVQTFLWSRQECGGRPGPCLPTSEPVATGAEQTYCVLSVKLPAVSLGAQYELSLLGSQVTIVERDGAFAVQ